MTLSDLSIGRPVLTWMMTFALIGFGILGYVRLGVDQFPEMEYPVVIVSATLEGAAPQTMEENVTDVLEEQINTISGIRSLRSQTWEGTSTVVAEFELDRDLDAATQDVRDRVALARRLLPDDIDPPVVAKANPNAIAVLWIPFHSNRSAVETSEYVRRNVKPLIETIHGVASIEVFGRRDRNIRIWLDGEALRARELTVADILSAIRREHVEVPGGLIESRRIEYTVRTEAEFRSIAALQQLVVARVGDRIVHLRDVARVEDGSEDFRNVAHFNGKTMVGLGIHKQTGGNTVAIVAEVMRRLDGIKKILPTGIYLNDGDALVDFARPIRESVHETEFALVLGGVLAVLTVFVFLRRTRPTLIIATAIPVSMVATFGLVWLFGYTLNTMTLLGMTLAIGVVVDDAIIVLENIERHRDMGESAHEAAAAGTRQITLAAMAATISVAAVFIPVVFVQGVVGNFLREFGLTVAGSVMISLFVALTLTPMLAARMPPPKPRREGGIYDRLERAFTSLEQHYRRILAWSLDHRAWTLGIAALSLITALLFGRALPTEFFPAQDQSIFFTFFQTPPGSSITASTEQMTKDESWLLKQPEVAGLWAAVGISGPGRPGRATRGMMFATLKPLRERKRGVRELMQAARTEFEKTPGRKSSIVDFSQMMGTGARSGEFEVALRGNLSLIELEQLAGQFIRKLEQRGGIYDLDKSLKLGVPEVRVVPDRARAALLGVDAQSIATTIRAMIGGLDVATFKEGGHRYDIRVRLEPHDRTTPEMIENLFVRSRDGKPIELRNLVEIVQGAAPSEITRRDRQRSVTISGNLVGKALGAAVQDAYAVARQILPEGVTLSLSGQAKAMEEGAGQLRLAMIMGILTIYMVLGSQFESFLLPLTVMLTLPLAMVGALGALWLSGMTLNLFSLIGIILLFGLVTKNSILLVDYANQLRAEGIERREAMQRAAPVRMRPVLMTALAMIFAALPAAFGVGPGAETRAPMAMATLAGMLSSTLLTLVVIPVFYLVLEDFADFMKSRMRRAFGRSLDDPSSRT